MVKACLDNLGGPQGWHSVKPPFSRDVVFCFFGSDFWFIRFSIMFFFWKGNRVNLFKDQIPWRNSFSLLNTWLFVNHRFSEKKITKLPALVGWVRWGALGVTGYPLKLPGGSCRHHAMFEAFKLLRGIPPDTAGAARSIDLRKSHLDWLGDDVFFLLLI